LQPKLEQKSLDTVEKDWWSIFRSRGSQWTGSGVQTTLITNETVKQSCVCCHQCQKDRSAVLKSTDMIDQLDGDE